MNVVEFKTKLHAQNLRLYAFFVGLAVEIHKQDRLPTNEEIGALLKALNSIANDLGNNNDAA